MVNVRALRCVAGYGAVSVQPAHDVPRVFGSGEVVIDRFAVQEREPVVMRLAVGIDARRLAAVEPVRRLLQKGGARARFLQREIDLCLRRTMDPKRLARTPDPVGTVCRRTARQYVYYVSDRIPDTGDRKSVILRRYGIRYPVSGLRSFGPAK